MALLDTKTFHNSFCIAFIYFISSMTVTLFTQKYLNLWICSSSVQTSCRLIEQKKSYVKEMDKSMWMDMGEFHFYV